MIRRRTAATFPIVLALIAAAGPAGARQSGRSLDDLAPALDRSLVFDGASSGEGDDGRSPRPSGRRDRDDGEGGLLKRFLSPLSGGEDPDGPINTDRPSYTPSNALVPKGRVQVESGYTFTHDLTLTSRTNQHLFPELAVRVGLSERVELRTFWGGQSYSRTTDRVTGRVTGTQNGPTNLAAGFKWKLADQDGWIPQSALITDLGIPVAGTSPNSSNSVQPVLFLLYGWSLTERFSLAGSTALSTAFDRGFSEEPPNDSFEQYSQSLIGFFSATDTITLYHEWFVLARSNSSVKLPQHFMATGILYQPTPNLQFDLRAGLGLNDSPSDFFAGAGVSFRY